MINVFALSNKIFKKKTNKPFYYKNFAKTLLQKFAFAKLRVRQVGFARIRSLQSKNFLQKFRGSR